MYMHFDERSNVFRTRTLTNDTIWVWFLIYIVFAIWCKSIHEPNYPETQKKLNIYLSDVKLLPNVFYKNI